MLERDSTLRGNCLLRRDRGPRKGEVPLATKGLLTTSTLTMGILAFLVALVAVVSAGCGSAGVAVTAGGSTSSTSSPSSASTTASTVEEAGFSGVTLDGTEVSLSQYRGKPLVLVFMATW